ncbi:hypothetical protein GH153_03025 [bacterium]|nr:hypothetical protein [bacterium]
MKKRFRRFRRFRWLKNLFKRQPRIVKIINPRILLSDEILKELEEDQKKMRINPIRHGARKRGRRQYGRIISYPPTWKHREGVSWLYDDEK